MAKNSGKNRRQYYRKMLAILGSITRLFSDSKIPYLNYRVTENLFCKAFKAKNLARSDVSADATLNKIGYGIKTFTDKNGKSFQKVAEFNKDRELFKNLSAQEKIKKIAELRNARIQATQRIYDLNEMVYHCIIREEGKISVFECDMDLIELGKIKNIVRKKNTISFRDAKNEYSFNISKSTLYKRFITKNVLFSLPVKIIDDPFEVLEQKFSKIKEIYYKEKKEIPFIILPLYSRTTNLKKVHERSGLNQWNAGGRKRDFDEIYIQIPIWIHKRFPGFFPPRDKTFKLNLPDGRALSAKVCQENSKALMSKPNSALGKWLLRDVLNLKKGQLLTYDQLQKIGLDSVIVKKINKETYSIDFRTAGTYEEFLEENK